MQSLPCDARPKGTFSPILDGAHQLHVGSLTDPYSLLPLLSATGRTPEPDLARWHVDGRCPKYEVQSMDQRPQSGT